MFIRYTDEFGKLTILPESDYKRLRRLYKYAIKVATAEYLIEMVIDGVVTASHQVTFQLSPSMQIFMHENGYA